MKTDLRAVVECLLTAHYTEQEIVEYLTGPLGVADAEAMRAVRDCAGPVGLVGPGDARREVEPLSTAPPRAQSASVRRRFPGLPSGSSTVS